MLPEITDRIKALLTECPPLSLGLKSAAFVDNDWHERNGFRRIAELRGGYSSSWAGESVTNHTALNQSTVFACNRVISEPCGFLPLRLMQRKGDTRRPAVEHPMYSALHDAPNDESTAMEFRESRTSNTVLGGGGYAQIIRRSGVGTAIELQPLDPSQVEIDRDSQKRLVYKVTETGWQSKTFTVEKGKPQDIFHLRGIGWDGLRGYSVLSMARQSIGTALAAERSVASFYRNGSRLPAHLEMAGKVKNDQEFKKFKENFNAAYRTPNEIVILENDLKLIIDGLSMVDAQMLETRQFTVAEICRWFNISPHMVADLSRATFSNIEQLALEFVKFTLGAWLTRWEQALFRCILTPEEKKQGYYFKHNVNALLRGDFVSRMAGYASALQNGHLNEDEVRDLEDRDPVPNGAGQHYRVQMNLQTLTPDGQPDPAAAHLAARAKNERNAQ